MIATSSHFWTAIVAALDGALGVSTLNVVPPKNIHEFFLDALCERLGDHRVVLLLDDVHVLPADVLAGLDHLLRLSPSGSR